MFVGTTIISDCWKAYNTIEDEGYAHLKENRSLTFADPVSGAHTNTIKSKLPRYGTHKNMNDSYFCEYMWRCEYEELGFLEFIN